MYGICFVWKGACTGRITHYWWNGAEWTKAPVDYGMFLTDRDAEEFIGEQMKARKGHYFLYPGNDPFGETSKSRAYFAK